MILSSGLELKKVQTATSKHLGILPKVRVGGNSARVWSKQTLQQQKFSPWFIL